jgi:DNA gyrase subunit A
VTHAGYIKRSPTSAYRAQKRGGRGKSGITTKEEDFVENIFVTSTHSYILVFTDKGKLYWLKVHEIPESGLTTRGKPIVNLIQVEQGEKVQTLMPVREFVEGKFIFTATRAGVVKKTDLMAFSNVRANGIIATGIDDGDSLIGAALTEGNQDVMLTTQKGMSIRFPEDLVRAMGRGATGVKGISLDEGDGVVSLEIIHPDKPTLLTVGQNGFGKRTDLAEYRGQNRGGKGIITIKVNDRNGDVIAAVTVNDKDEVMLSTDQGTMIRMKVADISVIGRNTQGVRLIAVQEAEKVVSVARIAPDDEDDVAAPPAEAPPADETPQ